MSKLTHLDSSGNAHMVDVSAKHETKRIAVAKGEVRMSPETLKLVLREQAGKGDVLGVSRIAGIMAAKRTADLIPLCHPVPVSSIEINFDLDSQSTCIEIEATVVCAGRTGVEMEALTAVSISALTIYDMLKSAERGMRIENIRLVLKDGGKSGKYIGR